MNKMVFCELVQTIIKDVRIEFGLTQENMANTIGISKKTLVQIEKDRINLKWAEAVTFISIFQDSHFLIDKLGSDSLEIIQALALQKTSKRQFITLGGEIWWDNKLQEDGYTIQKHKLSTHYRILDHDNFRVFFSFSYKDTLKVFEEYLGKTNDE